MLLTTLALVWILQNTPAVRNPDEDRKFEVLKAEIDEAMRELQNASFELYRNASGTAWIIKAGDIDAWTPERQLLWVITDTSRNLIYQSGRQKQLLRFDCTVQTYSIEVTETFDRSGNLVKTYRPPDTPAVLNIIPGSPVDKVRVAFCPPELE